MAENVEYRWVEKNIPKPPCHLLNFGSVGDKTVETFTKKGYQVTGIDRLDDQRAIENYVFHKLDIQEADIPEKFDCIYSISTIEHIGLHKYGKIDSDGDIKAVQKLYDALKPNGIMFLTFPYGAKEIIPEHSPPRDWRVYDLGRLKQLVGRYTYSVTYFIAIGEYIRLSWRSFHDGEPPKEIYEAIHLDGSISGTDETISRYYTVACVKVWKI